MRRITAGRTVSGSTTSFEVPARTPGEAIASAGAVSRGDDPARFLPGACSHLVRFGGAGAGVAIGLPA